MFIISFPKYEIHDAKISMKIQKIWQQRTLVSTR